MSRAACPSSLKAPKESGSGVSISAFGSLKNSFRWLVSSPFVAVGLTLTRLPQADAWTRNSEVPVPV